MAWFIGTTLYKNESGQFCQRKGYDYENKLRIMGMVSGIMAIGLSYDEGCACRKNLSGSSVGYFMFFYFFMRIRTIPTETKQ